VVRAGKIIIKKGGGRLVKDICRDARKGGRYMNHVSDMNEGPYYRA
jgi:hypothetical protein